MIPPGLFPGLVRPGMQQHPPPGGARVMQEPASQGDTGDKDKVNDGSDKKEELNSEENTPSKGIIHYLAFFV